ncbi:single-stranded-DNA-specific exonuclease RecJ [Lentilactobacillus raoultii]|uniref:Single-stranded-DNA-specific exonuclease RecJ n=1 Tax=Lentilactobacillus raoultii TaxID=1987503 RepID=A0ABW3PT74_9LACO|nr:single-stranded-DNA-specific exonuclease RecJ [Lentilactobacillus raoultii]
MIDSKFKWQTDQHVDQEQVQKFSGALKIQPLVAKILLQRGIKTLEAAQDFLTPSAKDFHDPYLMHDMEKGVKRIRQAIENEEQITIYGDYDADGITSTTIMYETLTDLGANVDYYIPNRFSDGYGPNADAYRKIINGGTTLIITVDNGVAGNTAIDVANSLNCDVVVTDHHSLPEKLPSSYAIIHPRVKSSDGHGYPFGDLSGAGVAFKVAQALMEELPVDLIDVAAIGTIADVMSLKDENRAVVKFGLNAIQNTQRPGLMALIKVAEIDVAKLDEQDIGFGLAPRLNSLGRIGDAGVGVELLSTFDEQRATELAEFANQQNDRRKSLVDRIYQQAIQMVGSTVAEKTLVVVGDNWHQGVLGIVASKLVEKYSRPAIVLTSQEESNELKGSGRSVDSFDLFKAIEPIRDQTVGFGGHHSAIGLTIAKDKISVLKDQLKKAAEDQQLDLSQKPSIKIAAQVTADQVNDQFIQDLKVLAPFGQDNPKPIFEVNYDQLSDVQTMGKNGDHLRFKLLKNGHQLPAVAFGMGAVASNISDGALKVAGELTENTWNHRTTIQLMVTDLLQAPLPVVDERTQQLHKQMFVRQGIYVFFHANVLTQLKPYLNDDSSALMYNQVDPEATSGKNLFIVDCPDAIADLTTLLRDSHPKTTVFYLYKKHLISKMGMPDRNSYAKLFKFVKTHPNLNIGTHLQPLAQQLNLASKTVVFMIQVFLELDFIKIRNRIINLNPNYLSKDLKSAPSYHLREEQLETEKKLLVSNTKELVSFAKNYLDN